MVYHYVHILLMIDVQNCYAPNESIGTPYWELHSITFYSAAFCNINATRQQTPFVRDSL